MIDPIRDPLADRLKSMKLVAPPTLAPRVLAAARQPRRSFVPAVPRTRAWVGAVAAVCLLLAGASYFAPSFDAALASAPFVGSPAARLLQGLGLMRAVGRVTSFNDVASSSGYQVHLVGGYADAFQTILILHIDDPSGIQPTVLNDVKLTDQFGRSYSPQGPEWYQAQNGGVDQALVFEPLQWPASALGARLNLQLGGLRPVALRSHTIAGRWQLHGTLAVNDLQTLPLPASAQVEGTTFHFVSVRATPAALAVSMDVAGPLAGRLNVAGHVAGSFPTQPGLAIELIDPNGQSQMEIGGQTSLRTGEDRLDWLWVAPSGGRYQLVVTLDGKALLTRIIVVP